MNGTLPSTIVVEAILIMAWKFIIWLSPVFTLAAIWWVVNRTDLIIDYLFPNLEWERKLGWLNIKAERRAKMATRFLIYGVYLLMAAILMAMVWSVRGLADTENFWDPWAFGPSVLRFGIAAACLVAWILFLGLWLLPKIKADREEAGLKQYRAENFDAEDEERALRRKKRTAAYLQPLLEKPRESSESELDDIFSVSRMKRRR